MRLWLSHRALRLHDLGFQGIQRPQDQRLFDQDFPSTLRALGEYLGLSSRSTSGNGKPQTVATYDYRDESRDLLFQVVRFDPKDFRQRKPKPGGGWKSSTKGIRLIPYRLPELLAADPAAPVWIVEGEKDVDRLASLGFVATCNAMGAGKWRSEHAEFLRGRHVVVVPDNDERGRKHAQQVAASCHGLVASVHILELPGLLDKGDVSDWLNDGHTVEELQRLAEAAPELEPETTDTDESPIKEASVKLLADAISKKNRFAQDTGGKLYRFADGCYRRRAEEFIRGRVKALCIQAGEPWSSHKANEVVEFIRVDSPQLWERPPIDVVNVKNGLLQVADRVLLPHTPEHLSPIQLPLEYDLKATCPNIDNFVSQVFPPDAQDLAWEIPGWLMLPDISSQKAILLTGDGSNGKSTYLSLVTEFLGKPNTAALSLHKLESDQFAAARLIGKLANICPDLPSEHLAGTTVFKTITGGDPLTAEYKFKDSFDFTPYARLVFSANHAPRSADSSHAFFRRWLVIPFDRTFGPDGEAPAIPRDILDAMLTTPAELSGMLNKALDALDRLRETRRFSEPESVKKAWEDFRATTDPLAVWLDLHTITSPDAFVVRDVLRAAYNGHARHAGSPPLGPEVFGRALRKLRPKVEDGQKTCGGKRQWCYVGLGFKTAGPTAAQAAQDAQDNPLFV